MFRAGTVLAGFALAVLILSCSGSTKSGDPAAGSSSGDANGAGESAGGSKSGGAAQGGASAGAAAGGTPAWAEWAECEVTDDCIVVPVLSCCGCTATGVNVMHEEEARAASAAFQPNQCGPLGCANFPCPPDSMVACEGGRCVPKPGCSERDEATCDADELCETYSARLCTSSGDFSYFACGKPRGACDDALTCRVSPAGQQMLFPDSCVPDGYTQECPSQCN